MRIWSGEGRRWLRISCRTIHVATLCGLVGGALFDADYAVLKPWLVGVVISGGIILATDLYGDDPYLREVRGVSIVLKLALLAVALAVPSAAVWLLFVVIAISGMISHAPSRLRHYALWGPQRPSPQGDRGDSPMVP